MFARIKAAVARSEIEHKGDRQKRAARQRADLGKAPSGPPPTGYSLSAEVIPAEAAVVVDMFEKFAAGESIVGMVRRFTKDGVPTRTGKPWARGTVRTILTNPRYAGRAVYGREIVDGKQTGRHKTTGEMGNWEPIISEGLFDLVQSRLDDPARKTNRVGTDRKHLGSSLYRCGECGGTVNISGESYVCLRCRLLRTRKPIDDLVLDTMRERLREGDTASLLTPSNDARVIDLQTKSKYLREQIAVTDADYDAGVINGTRHRARFDRLSIELQTVDAERVTLLAGSVVSGILTAHDPVAEFGDATLGRKRALIDAFLDVQLFRGQRGQKGFDRASVLLTAKPI